MAYYPHPEGSATRTPQPDLRERAPVRWWSTRAGVSSVVALVALVALVVGGLLQLSHTTQARWLAQRTAALQHDMEVQAHERSAELELHKQRVAFHLGYVGMAMDRSRSDAERLAVLRLLDGFDGDAEVKRWAHTELAETEARLAAGLGRPGVPDLASAEIDPSGVDAADVEIDDAEAAGGVDDGEAVDTMPAAPELDPSMATAAQGAAAVGVLGPQVARPEEPSAAALAPEPAPEPPAAEEPTPAPARAAPASARSAAAERQARARAPTATVVTGADRRTRCAPGSVRTLRRVGANSPTCGAGPGPGQQVLLTGTRIEWIRYSDPSDKSSFVECACSAVE